MNEKPATLIRQPRAFLWLLAFLLLGAVPGLRAQTTTNLPAYEPFPSTYTEAEQLGATTTLPVWGTGNGASGSSPTIRQIAAMSYPSLLTQDTNTSRGLRSGTGTGKNRGFFFAPTVTNGTIYASFLFNLQTNHPVNHRLFATLSSGSGTGPSVDTGLYLDTANHLLVGKNTAIAATSLPASPATFSLVPSNTYLVVLRYTFNPGNSTNDEVALWVNPASLGNNVAVPAPSVSVTNGGDTSGAFQTFYYLAASSGLNNAVNFYMDEIRVGTNWADVTPTNSIAGNFYSITGGGSGCPGDSFTVGLNGSQPGVNYLLYTNGVYSGVNAGGTGASVNFGPQSATATYTVLATNVTTTGVSWMTGSAAITVLDAPAITAQPASVVTAANATIIYSVTASGSGLNYRWYRNGSALSDGGNLAGTTTALLTISPVAPGDAAITTAGYYCVITNTCGFKVTSTTNALTIQAAGSLVWQGVPTNTWDLATTANWTNSAGAAVVFNSGDNVTFDDSYQSAVAIISSSYLSPGTITVNSSQTIGFSGSGNIFGLNSKLQAIGTGTLAITNVNSFGGGTTISNGTVLLRNYNGLGSGTVNLTGGSLGTATLRIPMSGSASSGLTGGLSVTTNSILQFDAAGTYGCVLFGALTGGSGATLTVNHTGSALDRFRVYNTNFTCNANILLNSSFIEMASYNNAGTQVYNGVISGAGSLITRNSGGTILLNNTNTYTGGTTLSLGDVGLGANSANDLSYSPFGTGAVMIDVTSGNSGLFSVGGAHSVGNAIAYSSTTNTINLIILGTNQLTLSGAFGLSTGSDSTPTNRTIQVNNTAATIFSGVIGDNSLGCGIIKTGSGALYLDGANTYTGPTTISAGRLAGAGTIAGPVVVNTNGVMGGGSAAAIGTLTVNNDLTFTGGAFIRVNKSLSPAQSNDVVTVSGGITNLGTGTITVSNLGPALVIGDKFTLFNQAVTNGHLFAVTGANVTWTNKLALDGSIQVFSLAAPIANYPTNIKYSVSGSTLTVSWPTTHLGWNLQAQTNALNKGLSTNWVTIPGTSAVTSTNLTIVPANPTVFYRLSKP